MTPEWGCRERNEINTEKTEGVMTRFDFLLQRENMEEVYSKRKIMKEIAVQGYKDNLHRVLVGRGVAEALEMEKNHWKHEGPGTFAERFIPHFSAWESLQSAEIRKGNI